MLRFCCAHVLAVTPSTPGITLLVLPSIVSKALSVSVRLARPRMTRPAAVEMIMKNNNNKHFAEDGRGRLKGKVNSWKAGGILDAP